MDSHDSASTDEEGPHGIYVNRLPQTDALEGQTVGAALGTDVVTLRFADGTVAWSHRDGPSGTDAYDAVEVADGTFFVDIWRRSHDEREAWTLIADRTSGRALSVLTTVGEHERPGRPRVGQTITAGVLLGPGGEPAATAPPTETRDLLGKRLFNEYSPEIVFEHVYLNSRLCAWQCLRGEQPGHGDCDDASYWRLSEGRYVFTFRERLIPCASVLFLDLTALRSTGKFLSIEEDGRIRNGGIGARLHMLADARYPCGYAPV
ncbi:MoaF C-terminal domain-containing protein [Streptomyces spongiae]|uniref:Molybdenum cofactor biosynthesis protein F n=1 Tax=Streptomyces spongiae TaxID=565072 RepID=A0A5N8XAP3_9ACTN|nr:MoaF C-terminal domain-containing protein [Streptomyces spongiae]MPY56553.1 molybdenum cofactor biosynthesis protein F [Streptomyces spongiae]